MSKLEVIVTSGGLASQIDDVRKITNESKGTTGAMIAEEFLRIGATVHFVYGEGTVRPFRRRMSVDPDKPLDSEIERVKKAYEVFQQLSPLLKEYSTKTVEDYSATLEGLTKGKQIDVVVLSAAVPDYGGKPKLGKISSSQEKLELTLEKNPKIISLVKGWNKNVFQVGFKLLSGVGLEELIDKAYQSGIDYHSNLTVANTIMGGDFGNRATVIITPEKGLIPISMEELPRKLVEIISQRLSKTHYETKVNIDSSYQDKFSTQIAVFKGYVSKLLKLNMFEPYSKDDKRDFGFVALRVPDGGFLITSRGSNKRDMPIGEIVYVPKVDFKNRIVYVTSTGEKASLNANVAAKIFEERPEADVIVHAHISPGIENHTEKDYSPGTQEDVNEVMRYLRQGQNIVELERHGIIAIGKNLEDIIATVNVESAYTKFPQLYDLIYKRFQETPDFINLVSRVVGAHEKVLDLAAGTGDVGKQLVNRGYANISLADKSQGMLNVAQAKIGVDKPVYVTAMEDIAIDKQFDAVVVRQAINYLMDYQGLVQGLKQVHSHLNSGGRLIFNAPNYTGNETYGDKDSEYDSGGFHVKVKEMNLVQGRKLIHTQHCVLMKPDGSGIRKAYDMNIFGLFTKQEFESALREAGFSSVEFFGRGLTKYEPSSKTLYAIARK